VIQLDLPQRMALGKFLSELLASIRKDELLPLAKRTWVPGERFAAKFRGRVAAWVTVPHPRKEVVVISEPEYRAWVDKTHPTEIEVEETVPVTPALLTHLRAHFPQGIVPVESVRPGFTTIVVKELKDRGRFVIRGTGEPIDQVPGLMMQVGDVVPTVTLEDDAGDVIGAAWADLDLGGSLFDSPALPAGTQDGANAA
jgi:hypothetical protein